MSEEEYWSDGPKELYTEIPDNFNIWISDNADKIKAYKNLPYFLTDNANFIRDETVRFAVRKRSEYLKYKNDSNYTDVEINSRGGLKAIHKSHNVHNNDRKMYFGTMTGDDLEKEFLQKAFDSGHSVIFCEEGKKDKTGREMSALDMVLDGKLMDLASITTNSQDYRNQFISKSRQLKKYNSRDDVTNENNYVCLYFHDASMFDEKKVIEGYRRMIGVKKSKHSSTPLKNIICAISQGGTLKFKEYNF